jgi:TRAP-type C4-dicarboxylate transport system permease small subunit
MIWARRAGPFAWLRVMVCGSVLNVVFWFVCCVCLLSLGAFAWSTWIRQHAAGNDANDVVRAWPRRFAGSVCVVTVVFVH